MKKKTIAKARYFVIGRHDPDWIDANVSVFSTGVVVSQGYEAVSISHKQMRKLIREYNKARKGGKGK